MKRITQFSVCIVVALISQAVADQGPALSKYDQLKVAVQKICPVTGKPLGSMGDPLKVKIGEEEIFLCCKGCTKGQLNKAHWTTIHKNFAAAQGICPVMEKALPANPKSTVVNGQTVYICCPPCTKKIQADPTKYLTKVAGYYQSALKGTPNQGGRGSHEGHAHGKDSTATLSKRDQMKIAVQKICPVSGKPLGSMGTPQEVKAGGMDLFLCCEGCKEGKVNNQHWATIRHNISAAQGICPVMEKELPVNAKSTVVGGQLIFVCCPPCTKKIEKEPAKFLAKIDSYYMASLKKATAAAPVQR